MSRRGEKGRRVTNWKTMIARVQDYIIALGAFRLDYKQGCLEVDEFFPIDQPHVPKGSGIKVLLSEMFARARDYSGSLEIRFTRDMREDENGLIPESLKEEREDRKPRPIPEELVNFANERYSIEFSAVKEGKITHEEGVNLWFATLEIPQSVKDKIDELEIAGYLNKEMVAELVSREIWRKEEFIWIFLNSPRPEALLFGAELPEDWLYYSDSLYWGRAMLLATRLKEAVFAELTEGISQEEIERTRKRVYLEPQNTFFILRSNNNFKVPQSWMINKTIVEIQANEPVLLFSRPYQIGTHERILKWMREQVDLLRNHKTEIRVRCILLNSEFVDTLTLNVVFGEKETKEIIEDVKTLAEKAGKENIYLLFAPTRTFIFLDEEIQSRMRKARRMFHFPSRKGPLKLQIFEIEKEYWNGSKTTRLSKVLPVAVEAAQTFAEQIAPKREIHRHRKEFSYVCDVIEREILSSEIKAKAEIEGRDSQDLLNCLRSEHGNGNFITFPFVLSSEMPLLLEKIKMKGNEILLSNLERIEGGILVTIKPYEYLSVSITKPKASILKPFEFPRELEEKIDSKIRIKRYVSSRDAIMRGHELLRKSLKNGVPLSVASFRRPNVLVEVIRDYIFADLPKEEVKLGISYGDGTEGQPFELFSLPEIERPKGRFFNYSVGLVSLRHMDSDRFIERALVRNIAIQNKEDSAEQEELIFIKTCECIEEFLKFLGNKVDEQKLGINLKALLIRKEILKQKNFDGLRLHIFHNTALEPAMVGTYRAVLEMLKKYRGRLIIVPRILSKRDRSKKIEEEDYKKAEEWY